MPRCCLLGPFGRRKLTRTTSLTQRGRDAALLQNDKSGVGEQINKMGGGGAEGEKKEDYLDKVGWRAGEASKTRSSASLFSRL